MNRIERIVLGLLQPINPYATAILGIFTCFWGLWIVNPFWDVFSRAALYSKVDYFPEWAWGTWSTLCGLVIILALLKGKTQSLINALAFAVWHWGTFAYMFWWGDWQNTGGLTYSFVFIYTLYCYLNIKINYKGRGLSVSDKSSL